MGSIVDTLTKVMCWGLRPGKTLTKGKSQNFVGTQSLNWPPASGPPTEDFLVQLDPAPQLIRTSPGRRFILCVQEENSSV